MKRYGWQTSVRYNPHMPDWVRQHAIAGLTSNDDIAHVLQQRFDDRITAADVALWRRQHHKFNAAVAAAMTDFQAECASVIAKAVREGDVAAAKWYLERTSERFKPSSKVDMNSNAGALDERLRKRQMTEEELASKGVLYGAEPRRDIADYSDDEFYAE